MNWMSMLSNPKLPAIKKTMHEFLQDRYIAHDEIIERLTTALQTDKDTQSFLKMIMDCYELGYLRAVSDHKTQLAAMGFDVKVVASNS